MAEPDLNDKLSYYFYTSVSSNDDINFTWDFGDNSGTESTGNVNTNAHTFPKYGKTYPVTVTSNIGSNSLDSTVLIDIPSVTIDMECSTNGLTVICRPILPPEIPDMTVKWDCGNGQEFITVGDEIVVCQYDDNDTDVTVKVEGSDDNLEGTVTDEDNFTISKLFSMQVVERKATSSDKLTWQINVNGELKNIEGSDLSQYKVQYRFDYGDGNGFGEWKDADSNYDIIDTYTFSRYPANNKTGFDVIVQAQVIKDALSPEVSSTNTSFNISAPTATLTRENLTNSEGFGQKFCVKWTDYLPAGSLKYTWNFGDQQGTSANDSSGQCQTHVYKNAGKYDITVDITSNDSKFNAGYVKQLKGSVTFEQGFTGLDAPITITANENNPLSYTISSNVKSSASDGSGGAVGSGELEYKWEINTGTETVTQTGQSFTQVFPKYGKNYPVNLTVTLKGTDISTKASSQVVISKPVLKIETTQGIVNLDQQSSWTSSIKYNNKDIVINNGFSPVYKWSATDGTITNNGQSTLNHKFASIGNKTVTLNVTSPQFDETLTATGNVEVINPITLTNVEINCTNDQWDAVKYTCSAKLLDQNNGEITDTAYSVEWTVSEVSVFQTSQPSQSVNLILDWPTDRTANKTPSREFTANISVKKDGSQLKNMTQKLTVTRSITYTANIQGYNDNGFNRQAIINFSNVQGPDATGSIRYNWQYNFENKNGQKVNNTFSTNKNPGSHDFKFVQDQIQYIGSIKGDPFAGGNGIGLQIEGLSKPLTIYGVADNYAVFGPNFQINTGKSIVFQQRPGYNNMVGITGNTGWWAYAFAHNFQMNEQFKSGSFPYILKVEIQQNADVKHFNSNNGNGIIVSSFILEKDGMTTSSQYLGFQSDFPPVSFGFGVDVYGYHTSSDAKKDGSTYIKMGEAVYTYDESGQHYSWTF